MTRTARRALGTVATMVAVAAAALALRRPPAATGAGTADGSPGPAPVADAPRPVRALGRLEPKNGIIRVAGPSRPSVVVGRLAVDEGDRVRAGQEIAVLDSLTVQQAMVERFAAEVENA